MCAQAVQVFTGHDEEEDDEMDQGGGGSAGPSGHAQASGTRRSHQASMGANDDGADDDDESEGEGEEDEDESDEDFDPDAKRARKSGEGGAAGEAV